MKRIEFIAPVESMRGSFSPKQTLLYAENNNPAFDAPVGRQYARNYSPIFIGAKRAASGLKYFAAKTKSATLISPASKLKMALLGAAGAIYAVITADKESADFAKLYAWYEAKLAQDVKGSLRKLATDHIMSEIKLHKQSIVFTTGGGPAVPFGILNPWYAGTQSEGYEISSEVIVKFWMQLAPNPIKFTVDGAEGIAKTGMTFFDLLNANSINILGLSNDAETSISDIHIMLNDEYLLNGENYVLDSDVIGQIDYTTTDQAPA